MMNSFLRPSLSDSDPKKSAPTTSPARYTVAMRPAWVELIPIAACLVSRATTAPATVISRPSRIHATPSATTIRGWKGDHARPSIRAGIRLRMAPGAGAWLVVVIDRLRAGLTGWDCRSVFPRKPHVNRAALDPLPDRGTLLRRRTFAPDGGSCGRGTSHRAA